MKPHPVRNNVLTLHKAVASLERQLYKQAHKLEKQCRSMNDRIYWQARGGQQTLRQVAGQLRALRRQYRPWRVLRTALDDYLQCLQTQCADAEEETKMPMPKRGISVMQWKAEGESMVLPGICVEINHLVETYVPQPINWF